MHAHYLHYLANVNWYTFQSSFANPINPLLVKWCQCWAIIFQLNPDITPTVSTWLSSSSSRLLTHCEYMWMLQPLQTMPFMSSFFFGLCHHPLPCTFPSHPHSYAGPKLMNSLKNHKKLTKIRHYYLSG